MNKFTPIFLCPKCRGQCFSSWKNDSGVLWRRCTSEKCTYTAAEYDDHMHFVVRYETLHGYKKHEEQYLRMLSKSINATAKNVEKKELNPDHKKKEMN